LEVKEYYPQIRTDYTDFMKEIKNEKYISFRTSL